MAVGKTPFIIRRLMDTIAIWMNEEYSKLDLRHEETFQSARSRQHRSRIVEKQIDFFFLIASMGQSLASQGEPRAPWASKASQPESPGHPDRAARGRIEPARASQKRPGPTNRASQGARTRPFGQSPSCPRGSQDHKPGRAISIWRWVDYFTSSSKPNKN